MTNYVLNVISSVFIFINIWSQFLLLLFVQCYWVIFYDVYLLFNTFQLWLFFTQCSFVCTDYAAPAAPDSQLNRIGYHISVLWRFEASHISTALFTGYYRTSSRRTRWCVPVVIVCGLRLMMIAWHTLPSDNQLMSLVIPGFWRWTFLLITHNYFIRLDHSSWS